MSMPKYQVMPPLTEDEYANLKASIAERGVLVAVIYDEDGTILDGHNRVDICRELGITDWPKRTVSGMTDAEKRSYARTTNVLRRHLSRSQRRSLIVDELQDAPTLSNLTIAKRLGVSDHTVAKIRRSLGLDAGQVIGADGKAYDATRGAQGPQERLVYTIVFSDQESYTKWMTLVREVKKANPGTLLCDALTQAVENGAGTRWTELELDAAKWRGLQLHQQLQQLEAIHD